MLTHKYVFLEFVPEICLSHYTLLSKMTLRPAAYGATALRLVLI